MPTAFNQLDRIGSSQATKTVAHNKVNQREAQLKKACRDFEAIFVNYMMKQMRQTVNKSDVMGPSQAEELYTSMMDNEVAKNVSQARGMGLASMIYRQMSGIIDGNPIKK